MGFLAGINWDQLGAEAEDYLVRLIQFPTVNPPGDELPAARWLAEVLRGAGLSPEVFESAPNRGNLVCRLPGTGEKPPLLLNGHLDVVPVEEARWSHPPFAAVKADGYLWGRGAVDMKHMLAMSLAIMLAAKKSGVRLKRDLIYLAVADEEAGGRYGAQWMVENQAEKIRAEYGLGEMGGFTVTMSGRTIYPVQVAEKGICWVRLKAQGDPGHGSIPDAASAPLKLARALEKIGRIKLPQHNTPVVETFLRRLSAGLPLPNSLVLKLLLHPSLSEFILDRLFPDPGLAATFWALLRNTANPTVLRAGEKTNVIPSEATAEIDGRLLPGQTAESFLAELREVVGPGFEFEVLRTLTPTAADPDDPLLAEIAEVIHRHDPGALVAPNLVPGFTDATHYAKLGIKCFGFSPVRLGPADNFKSLFHGHNERIPLAGFRFGVRLLAELVERLAG